MAVRAMMYDPSATYVARRKVRIEGRDYDVGELVPRELAADARTYEKWFGARMLMKAEAGAPAALPVPKAMVPVVNFTNNSSEPLGIEINGVSHAIPAANGHHVPASEMLMDAVAAQAAVPAASPVPAGNPNEGYIEPGGRGWCRVIFRGKEEKVRGFALASKKLDEFRAEAGLAPLSPEDKQADPEGTPELPVGALQPGDQVVDGETGEISTIGEEIELPDDETPSTPWTGDAG